MKKFCGTFLSVLFFTTLTLNIFAFESTEGNYLQPILSETVTLSAMDYSTRSILTEEFTLYTYDDNGVILYSIDVEDPIFMEAANSYLLDLTDTNQEFDMDLADYNQEYVIDLADYNQEYLASPRIVSGEESIAAFEGNARQSGYVKNTHNQGDWRTFHSFSGNHVMTWVSTVPATEIALSQEVSIRGIGITVSWPPSFNGSSNTRTWSSTPIQSNTVSASLGNLTACSFSTSAEFRMGGHVLAGTHFYRPERTVTFGTFS